MKRFSIILAALLAAVGSQAQTFTEWQDPNVNAINRQPMHSTYKVFESVASAEGAYCDEPKLAEIEMALLKPGIPIINLYVGFNVSVLN